MNAKIVSGLILAVLSFGAAPESTNDLSKLQGRWETKVGLAQGDAGFDRDQRECGGRDDRDAAGRKIQADGELKLDETTSPKALDWVKFTTIDGEEVPEMRAIYRLEEGRLYIRSGGFNDDRPTGFDAGEGVWANVLVFRAAVN